MRGGVGAGGAKPPATRFGNKDVYNHHVKQVIPYKLPTLNIDAGETT